MRKTKRLLIAAILLAVMACSGLLYCTLKGIDPIVRKTVDVDITSGRLRTTKLYFGLFRTQTISGTPLSDALGVARPVKQPVWKRCYSPLKWGLVWYAWMEGNFTGAPSTIASVEAYWADVQCPNNVRRKMASDIVTMWEEGGSDKLAYSYLEHIEDCPDLPQCYRQILEAKVYSAVRSSNGDEEVFRYHDGTVMFKRKKVIGR